MIDTTYTWADTYQQAVTSFGGQHPTTALEDELVTRFRETPAAIIEIIENTAQQFAAGRIHSPWAIVKKQLDRTDQRRNITTHDNAERAQAIHLTETYITNAALRIPTETELLDDTFGSHGRLRKWANDPELRERIAQHWRNQQPRIANETASNPTEHLP